MEDILRNESDLVKSNELIKKSYNEFELILEIYIKALNSLELELNKLKKLLNEYYKYDVITNITSRIKTPQSIVNKMKKKKLDITYENMIEHINDIAGVRIICNYKDDIYKIRDIIRKQDKIRIVKEKDYIKKAKKSGYSAYHMIIEVPIKVKEEIIYIKTEIQIKTALMDFWATTEHKIKYKSNKKISSIDSARLSMYGRIVNIISDKMTKIFKKQQIS